MPKKQKVTVPSADEADIISLSEPEFGDPQSGTFSVDIASTLFRNAETKSHKIKHSVKKIEEY